MIDEAELRVEHLAVSYGMRQIIRDLTLPAIGAGSVAALVGPNGAGKSTILKALAQIIPSRGDLRLGGVDLRQLAARERAKLTGFMPQGLPLAAELTVLESVVVVVQAGNGSADPEQRALQALGRVGIADLALRQLSMLSGGERQLVSLAQAIALSPRLLFLDEPTSALDLARQHDVMRLVRSFARDGTTVIMVLHDLGLAAHWADLVIVLEDGRLHSAGQPAAVVTSDMLRAVYGVAAHVRMVDGRLFVVPEDGETPAHMQDPRISR